jgi:death-on-curing protein
VADVIDAHEQALAFGGLAGIVNPDALLSAIGRPYSGHHRRIWSKAAALAESLIRNHPFVDGNKRTALIVVSVLVDRSGWKLGPHATSAAVEEFMVSIARGDRTFAEIEDWFHAALRPLAAPEV